MTIEKMKNSDKTITENVPNWVNLFDSIFKGFFLEYIKLIPYLLYLYNIVN
jgi:ABC-type uncharacterized transport system fused permease/ATPase subunit